MSSYVLFLFKLTDSTQSKAMNLGGAKVVVSIKYMETNEFSGEYDHGFLWMRCVRFVFQQNKVMAPSINSGLWCHWSFNNFIHSFGTFL